MRSNKLIMHISVACILLINLIISQNAIASNRAIDMKLVEKGEQTIFTLLLEERPKYSLKTINRRQVLLTLHDTSKAPLIDKRVAEKNDIGMDEGSESLDLKLRINMAIPFDKIDSSWIPNEKLLYLEISSVEESMEQETEVQASILKTIRFGFKEKATRMVMGLDQRPIWEMTYHDPTAVVMQLEATSNSLKDERYGPIKWLKEVTVLKQEDNKMDIGLQIESPLNHVRIFWMNIGNRLVMDLFDEPMEIDDKDLLLALDSDTQKEGGDNPENDIENKIDQKTEKPETADTPDTGHIVRMKIPKREGLDTDQTADIGSAKIIGPLMVEPKMDTIFPSINEGEELVQGLSPEEAFLFGRIQEAREINDFERGVVRTNHFLTEFPDSTLIEKISFWRGDFYYHLWKRGDESITQKVINAYKYAIDHFGSSKYAPLAYIKMAQANSTTGNHYEAIGYLSLLINKKEGDYLPLAYLTRGKIYLQMDQTEKAISDFQILLSRYPDSTYNVEANFWIANYYHLMGLYEEAEKRLNEIAGSDSQLYLEYPEHLSLCAKNSLYLKNYDIARDYLLRAVNIGHQPETVDLLLSRIGDTYHQQDNEKEAEKYFRMVIDYYPESEGASISKLRLADYFSDISILEDLSNENMDEPIGDLALLEKAYQLYEKEQYIAALDSLDELIAKPFQAETRKEARQLYYRSLEKEITRLYHSNRYKELTDLYRSKRKMLADNIVPEINLLVAQSFNNLHLYSDAISAFLEMKPYDLNQVSRSKYIYGLASSYFANGDEESAQKLLEKNRVGKLDTLDQQKMTMLLADIHMAKGTLRDAYDLYQSLVKGKIKLPDKEIARAYLFMGKILNREANYKNARKTLNRSIALAEKDEESKALLQSAYIEIGDIYHNEKKYLQAVKSFEHGFELGYGPDNNNYWKIRFRLALSYLATGEPKKAEPLLNEISEGGDTILQQKAQIRLGAIGLDEQLKQLSFMSEIGN